ncbi:patatin family protein [Bacillaceae bacterium S4-13-56]
MLEGGGMRGAFTAGVLDFFLDKGIEFPYVVGVSAGACNGSSYFSKQRERNYKVIVEYGDHPEYISYKRGLKGKGLFGMDFLFDTLPNDLVPFNYESFFENTGTFSVGVTDVFTGKPVFFSEFKNKQELLQIMRASSSLPLVSPEVELNGRLYLDGGISSPIPIEQSVESGNEKHVIILTRNDGYIKKPMKFSWIFKKRYNDYPSFIKTMEKRYFVYNHQLEMIKKLEREGKAFIIRPSQPLQVSRVERNREKLHTLYQQGYQEGERIEKELTDFLLKNPQSQLTI